MSFYVLLAIATAIIAFLTILIWRKTKSICFPFGIACLYFWSLYGAWAVVGDNLNGEHGKKHHYLYDDLFPVELNSSYAWSLIYYSCFIVTIQLTLLTCLQRRKSAMTRVARPLVVSHHLIIAISSLCGLGGYWIIRDSIATAAHLNVSAYVLSRSDSIPFFSLYTLLNRAALVPPAIGLAIYASGSRSRLFIGRSDFISIIGYVLVIGGMVASCAVLGNKAELFMAAIAGYLFYLANHLQPRIVKLHVGMFVVFAGFVLIDVARAVPIVDMLTDLSWLHGDEFLSAANSNEAFGAHFSMYGAVHYKVPMTYGTSLISLAASVIPRGLWIDRPPGIYMHYAEYLGFANLKAEGQGYSVHHATGWYLNCGFFGVLMGAFVFARIWSYLYNMSQTYTRVRDNWQDVFLRVAPWTFTAAIPSLLRAGPEGYKGVLLEAFIIPCGVLMLVQQSRVKLSTRIPGSQAAFRRVDMPKRLVSSPISS